MTSPWIMTMCSDFLWNSNMVSTRAHPQHLVVVLRERVQDEPERARVGGAGKPPMWQYDYVCLFVYWCVFSPSIYKVRDNLAVQHSQKEGTSCCPVQHSSTAGFVCRAWLLVCTLLSLYCVVTVLYCHCTLRSPRVLHCRCAVLYCSVPGVLSVLY